MSSTPLMPTILEVGLQALWLTSKDGVAAKITHIALGEAAYTPHQGLVRLQAERARYPIADGKAVSSTQVHLTALADGNAEFWVREVGFYLADGTCLAIWSDPNRPLAYKAAGVDLLLAYDLMLSALPPGSVTVQSTGAGLSLAMAEELAALATGQISEMHRGLKRDEQDRQHAAHLTTIDQRLAEQERKQIGTSGHVQELDARELRHHAAQTELATAQAAVQVTEMLRGLRRDDRADQQAARLAAIDQRLVEQERKQVGTSSLVLEHLALATAQAAALISLQCITLQQTVLKP